jgi:hypothetical protein
MTNATKTDRPTEVGQIYVMSSMKDNPFDRIDAKVEARQSGYVQYSLRLSDGTFSSSKFSMKEIDFLAHYELSAIEH